MSNRLAVSAVFVAVVSLALSSAACSDDRTVPLAPAPFGGLPTPSVLAIAVQPIPLVPQTIIGGLCPFTHPFVVPFDLHVRSGASALFLNQVRINFVDSFGTSGPQLTIPQPDLNVRFRTTSIAAQTSREFPFSFEFGCGTARRGTLSVFVQTNDEAGRMNDGSLTVVVR
jgi:hypothetical protein